ncbi:type II secretion system F family protein [Mumia xiangluensis]|uniref:Type II secretion system F family protein n=1 Tax=Mumia xiangluensis TaxID=1678900 RepID=A0ABW1QMC2_9ACTN
MTGAASYDVGVVAAGALAATAGWLLAGRTLATRQLATVSPAREGASDEPAAPRGRLRGPLPIAVPVATVVVLAGTGVTVVAVLVAGCVAWLVAALRLRSRARTARRRTHAHVTAACEALAAELAAGLPPSLALERVAADHAELRPVDARVRLGGDAAAAFRAAAMQPGAEGLRDVAAAWSVSVRSGAGLAAVLDRVVEGLRARDDIVREVDATLGPPRATARLLAVLPLLALALGAALGGNPVAFLLSGGIGSWCLATGAALAVAGVLWVERITDGAAR